MATRIRPTDDQRRAEALDSADARAAQERRRRLSLAAVLSSTLGLGIAYGIGYTITTLRFEAWGAAGWLTGLAGAVPSLAVVLFIPFAPRLAGRLGAVPTMLAGAVLVAATFVLMPLLPTPGWWLLLRFLSGIGLALPWLVGETWINTVSRDASRGRVLAVYTVLIFGGWAAGPLLLDRIGTGGTVPYLIGIAGIAVTAVPLLLARRLAPELPAGQRFSLRRATALAPLAMAAAAAGGVAEFSYISLLPVYAVDAGATTGQALRLLSVLMIGGVVLQFGVGWVADRYSRVRVLAWLGIALTAAALTLGVAIDTPVLAFAAAFVLGGVVLGFYAVGLAILGEEVPAGQLATANAAYLISYEVGATGGPLVAGTALDAFPPHGFTALLAVVGLAFTAAIVVARTRR